MVPRARLDQHKTAFADAWPGKVCFMLPLSGASNANDHVPRRAGLTVDPAQLRLFVEQAPVAIAMFDRAMRAVGDPAVTGRNRRRWVDSPCSPEPHFAQAGARKPVPLMRGSLDSQRTACRFTELRRWIRA